MLVLFILLGLIMVSGFLTRLPKDARYLLPIALAFTAIQATISVAVTFLLMWLLSVTGAIAILLSEVNALFVLILIFALIGGITLYWLTVVWMKRKPFDTRVLTLMEYIIQWSLIYITVYQVLYDNIIPTVNKDVLQNVSAETPTDMMIAVLPALLAVWISVIMYKVREKLL